MKVTTGIKSLAAVVGLSCSLIAQAQTPVDLVLVVDHSGSLSSTDPGYVRYRAIEQLMSRIGAGSTPVVQSGYVGFGMATTDAEVIVPLAPNATSVKAITDYVAKNVAPTGLTPTDIGITTGASQLSTAGKPGNKEILVVFTDGSPNSSTATVDAAKAAAAKGYTVHVVALGSSATSQSNIDTAAAGNGRLFDAKDVDALVKIFSSNEIFTSGGGTTAKTFAEQVAQIIPTVSQQVQRATSVQQATIISTVLSSIGNRGLNSGPRRVALGSKTGMAAGEEAPKWNAWVNVSGNDVSVKSVFEGDVQNYIAGVDYAIDKDLVVGVTLAQDKTNLNLYGTNLKSGGNVIAPYVSYQINETYSADAAIGYAQGKTDYSVGMTATQDFTRSFFAANLNGNWWFDDIQVNGKASYISAEESLKNFTDNAGTAVTGIKNRTEQIRVGVQAGKWIEGVMPYVGLAYVNDLRNPSTPGGAVPATAPGKEAYNITLGANIFVDKSLFGGIVFSSEQGRSNSKNDILMINVGYRF